MRQPARRFDILVRWRCKYVLFSWQKKPFSLYRRIGAERWGKAGIRDKIILYAKIRKDSQNKRVLSGFFNIYRVYYKLFTASAICLEVRPYSSNRAAGVPDCPNRSLIPTFLNLKSPFPIRTSATASPKPPMMECSSTVSAF